MSKFDEMCAIDVSKHIEKKNGLSYLSWAWAVQQLLKADPTAIWAYNEPKDFNGTLMVSCTVTAFGKPMTMHLPVMDYRNKAIPSPDAFAVNTAMMRCLVKAIACHGLGLYIYAGEDLPETDHTTSPTKDESFKPDEDQVTFMLSVVDNIIANKQDIPKCVDLFYNSKLDNEEKIWIWDKLKSESTLRAAIKKYHESLKKE
jgi:Protein of unknown function (DUF1071)